MLFTVRRTTIDEFMTINKRFWHHKWQHVNQCATLSTVNYFSLFCKILIIHHFAHALTTQYDSIRAMNIYILIPLVWRLHWNRTSSVSSKYLFTFIAADVDVWAADDAYISVGRKSKFRNRNIINAQWYLNIDNYSWNYIALFSKCWFHHKGPCSDCTTVTHVWIMKSHENRWCLIVILWVKPIRMWNGFWK